MKKKRKKITHIEEGGGCFLDIDTGGHAFHNHHHPVVAESPRCNDSVIILNCMHYYIKELDILHECSLLCLGILCHSCGETEMHVEKNFYYMKLYNICDNSIWFMHSVLFLQVSSKIPHRQGFRPPQVWPWPQPNHRDCLFSYEIAARILHPVTSNFQNIFSTNVTETNFYFIQMFFATVIKVFLPRVKSS